MCSRAARRRSSTARSRRPRRSSPATGSGRSARSTRRSSGPSAARRPRRLRSVLEIRPFFEMEDFDAGRLAGDLAKEQELSSGPGEPERLTDRAAGARWRLDGPSRSSGGSSRRGSIASLTRAGPRRRPGRGARAGRVRRGPGAVADRRRAGQARRLADDHRPAPGDRPDPPGAEPRRQVRAAGARASRTRRPADGAVDDPSATTCSRWCSPPATRCCRASRGSRSRCGCSAG